MRFAACLTALVLLTPAQSEGDRTVTKVVKILQEMLTKSKADGETDTMLFAKYKCYCDTNTADKRQSIQDDTLAIELLSSEIAELQASNGKLSTENAELEMMIGDNERARTTATTIRDGEESDFLAEEADMIAAIGQMDQAISTLAAIGADQTVSSGADHAKFMAAGAVSNAGGASLLKLSTSIKGALNAASMFLNAKQKKTITAFIQAPFGGTYTSQSGEIVGILKNMRDTFKSNLASARATERAQNESDNNFQEVKNEEHTKMSASYTEKDGQLGTQDGTLSTKKTAKETAETSKAAAEDFLGKLITLCADKTKEYEDRKMIRANEDAAIAQATSILNSDAAFDTFGANDATSTGATGFLQVESESDVRERVRKQLEKASKKNKSLKLARVAVALGEGNPFEKVVTEVEDMISLIAEEETADDTQKAWCDSEREENHQSKSDKESNINTLNGTITDLVDTLDSQVDGLRKLLADEQETLRINREDQAEEISSRAAENAAYQTNIGNLVQAEKILTKATDVLKKFYEWLHAKQGPHHYDTHSGKDSGGSNIKRMPEASIADLEEACSADPACVGFNSDGWLKSALQPSAKWYDSAGSLHEKVMDASNPVGLVQTKEDPAPPGTFEGEADSEGAYAGQTDQGNAVVNMLTFILSESEVEEEQAHTDEESAQHTFEDNMNDFRSAEATSVETIASLEEQIAEKEKELEQARTDLEKTDAELKAIEKYLLKIKPGCDFITDNIQTRKDNRAAETTALNNAITQLKGTPVYEAAAAEQEKEELGACADKCIPDKETLACKACLAGVSESGYCASHSDFSGC